MHDVVNSVSPADFDDLSSTGAITIHFLIGACVNTFGVLFNYIQERFDASAKEITWIPAIMICLLYLTGEPGMTNRIPIISQGHKFIKAIYDPLPVHKSRNSGFEILQRILGFITPILLRNK